jgi:hypothetical protein
VFLGGIYINNWIELTPSEEEKVWNRLYTEFQFKPSMSEFPSFFLPKPFITFDISTYLNGSLDPVEWDFNYAELEETALSAFQNVTSNDDIFML